MLSIGFVYLDNNYFVQIIQFMHDFMLKRVEIVTAEESFYATKRFYIISNSIVGRFITHTS